MTSDVFSHLAAVNPSLAEYLRSLAESASMSKCTIEEHEAAKSKADWDLMEYVGIQEVCEEYSLELRNCKCGSTLAKKIFHKNS